MFKKKETTAQHCARKLCGSHCKFGFACKNAKAYGKQTKNNIKGKCPVERYNVSNPLNSYSKLSLDELFAVCVDCPFCNHYIANGNPGINRSKCLETHCKTCPVKNMEDEIAEKIYAERDKLWGII